MNELIVDVKLWGKSVGSLYWEKETWAAVFDYEKKFVRSGLEISPIVMPLNEYRDEPYQFLGNRNNCFKGLPGLFADFSNSRLCTPWSRQPLFTSSILLIIKEVGTYFD